MKNRALVPCSVSEQEVKYAVGAWLRRIDVVSYILALFAFVLKFHDGQSRDFINVRNLVTLTALCADKSEISALDMDFTISLRPLDPQFRGHLFHITSSCAEYPHTISFPILIAPLTNSGRGVVNI